MADWEEVKRLAADFQRAQLTSTVQRLSDRNCIEIVRKLQELNLIDVIYTTDGKEYLTPTEVSKEVREELQVHGGRINLTDLQQIINVDFSHIESKANDVANSDKSISLVLGQLVDESYLDNMAEEINDKLQDNGQITFAELTKSYDLPADFIREAVLKRMGTVIHGNVDEYDKDVIFTESFVDRHRAKIRGALSAITKPTSLINVINSFNLQERLFFTILEDLIRARRLGGSVSGGQQEKALYVPDVYSKAQTDWVDSFYRQNGYLEYDSVQRLGITDPKSYIKKRFKSEPLVYLSSCCAGKLLQDQIEAEVEEALANQAWVDIMPVLPSIFNKEDAAQLLHNCLKKQTGASVYCDTIVTSNAFVTNCSKPFKDIMATKAEKDAKTNTLLLAGSQKTKVEGLDDGGAGKEDRRDQRKKRQAGASKSGGGTQGREVKTKAVKKKYGKNRDKDLDSDEDVEPSSTKGKAAVIPFLTPEEIEVEISKHIQDVPPEFIEEIAVRLHRPLTQQYQDVARSIFLQTSGTATGSDRKKTHGDLQEKVSGLWTNVKLFEKGIKCFNAVKKSLSGAEEMQAQLAKHLLRTVCSDITNAVFTAIATEQMLTLSEETELTTEMRVKLLGKIPDERAKAALTKLHKSLNEKTIDPFSDQLEVVCAPDMLGVVLRKPDKKKEKNLVFSHRQSLAAQLREETDPAMVLHLATVLLFQIYTQCMVHAPGRLVPQLVAFLQEHLKEDQYQTLCSCRDLVVKQLKAEGDEKDSVTQELTELLPQVREIALTSKKGGGAKEEKEEENT